MPQLLIVDGDQGSPRALCAQLDAGPYDVGGCAPEQVDASLAAGKPDAILFALGENPSLPLAVIFPAPLRLMVRDWAVRLDRFTVPAPLMERSS